MSTNATSLWACNALGFSMFVMRLGLRAWRREPWNQGDAWTVSAGLFMIVRVTVSHYILMYGTTTTLSPEVRAKHEFSEEKIYWLITNSKLNLVSRFVLNGLLWSLKMVVFDFLRRIIKKLKYEKVIIIVYLFVIGATWAVATINIFTECKPFEKWWQIYPDPGPCVQGNMWLLTYEVGNMLTDAMLLALPFPLLFKARIGWGQRLRLCSVFSLGFFLIAVSVVRIVQGLTNSRIQLSRTMWASIETLFACLAACGPSIYCLIRRGHEGSSFDPSNPHSSKGLTSGSRSRTHHSVLRSNNGDRDGHHGGVGSATPGFGGHGAVHFHNEVKGGRNHHGRGEVSMWTDVSDGSSGRKRSSVDDGIVEMDSLKLGGEVTIAEDASTKGILVATTLHQVHEYEPRRSSRDT